jgi:nucleoside-diphosphate-sugar epimerase
MRKEIVFQTAADSAKDYISIDNVADSLIELATHGTERIYNLASGRNASNGELAERLRELTGCAIRFSSSAPLVTFPPINIDRLRAEFDFQPSRVLDDMPQLVDLYRRNLESSHDQS